MDLNSRNFLYTVLILYIIGPRKSNVWPIRKAFGDISPVGIGLNVIKRSLKLHSFF